MRLTLTQPNCHIYRYYHTIFYIDINKLCFISILSNCIIYRYYQPPYIYRYHTVLKSTLSHCLICRYLTVPYVDVIKLPYIYIYYQAVIYRYCQSILYRYYQSALCIYIYIYIYIDAIKLSYMSISSNCLTLKYYQTAILYIFLKC